MKSIKLKILLSVAVVTFSITGCNLDINVDPNSPATVPSGQLLSTAQIFVADGFGLGGNGMGQIAQIWVHQTFQRSGADSYATTGSDGGTSNAWGTIYAGAIEDLETIIAQSAKDGTPQYSGVAKLMKAFTYNTMVDLFGDIPFSEAGKGAANQFPKFDKGQDVYAALFTLVDEALAELVQPPPASKIVPGTDDLIYGGNLAKWRAFGKALKLRMYNTLHNTAASHPLFSASAVTALLTDPDITGWTIANDFEFKYFNSAAPENRNPAYLSVANAGTFFSRYLYEIMTDKVGKVYPGPPGVNNHIFDGIVDPRLNYYLYRSIGSSNNPTGGNPREYEDKPFNFLSTNFASQGPNQGFDQSSTLSAPGLYYCGGRYDPANVGGAILVSTFGTGAVPQRFLCQYELLHIRAELELYVNNNAVAARTLLSQGIDAAFAKVNQIATANNAGTISNAARDLYRDGAGLTPGVLTKFDAAAPSKAGQIEVILTSKWIGNFGNPIPSYVDYRRTGFPKMLDPNADEFSFTTLSRAYPFSYPYRQLDTSSGLNPNAPAQKLIGDPSAKVFWDID